jgi:hypothetical protein
VGWSPRVFFAVALVGLPSCSLLYPFPDEGTGGGGAGVCEPLATEACVAEPTASATGCATGTRTCAEDGSGFGPCACGALSWAGSFGSANGTARGTSVAVGPDGSVVVAGLFTGAINLGGATLSSAGGADLFLAKFSAKGEHQWSKSFGDAEDQTIPPVVAVDSTGAVVLAGGFTGTLALGGADLVASSVFGNVFVAKFDASGAHVWSHAHGDRGAATSVAVGPTDGIALAGVFRDVLSFGAPGGNVVNFSDGNETFVARLDVDGSGIWNTGHITSDYEDTAIFVRVGPSNETLVAGVFVGDLLASGPIMLSSQTPVGFAFSYGYDPINDDITVDWGIQLNGAGAQTVTSIAVDGEGDLVLAGHYKGTLEAGTQPPLQSTDTTEDLFLVKLAGATGDAVWSKSVTEAGSTEPTAVAVDAAGAITVVGSMNGQVDFGGGAVALAKGATDAEFLAKYDASGAHVWSKAVGAADALVSFADVTAEPTTGELCVTGNLVGAVDLGQGVLSATDDVLVAKFAP